MRSTSRRTVWLVLVALGGALLVWTMLRRGESFESTAPNAPRAVATTRAAVDLADPSGGRERTLAESTDDAPATDDDPLHDGSAAESLGGLKGTLWIAAELATLDWRIRVERVPTSQLARTSAECRFTGTACLEFDFDELVPGWYTARVELLQRLPPRSPSDGEGTELAELLHVDYGLEVVAGERAAPVEWDPLDLRDAYRLARYVLVDENGVPWRRAAVGSRTDAKSDFTSVSDDRGNVEIVVAAAARRVEVALRGVDACAVTTPFTSAWSVVVVPRRPTYVLEIDPSLVTADRWLGLSIRPARTDDSELSERVDWEYAEFEPGSSTLRLTPSRLGPHELEWLVRTRGRGTVFIDSLDRLDVQAAAEPVHVRLELPEQVLAALR